MLVSFFTCMDMVAQPVEVEEAIRSFTGESEIEKLDVDQVELMYALFLHPVDINDASQSMLESTGLFTPFQLVALMDYRSRHGCCQP